MLTCYLHRRRIPGWVDGTLDPETARATAAHADRCTRCRGEAEGLRRLAAMLRAIPAPRDPDWIGFWPGVVRRIDDAGRAAAAPRRRAARIIVPPWAYGGALAAALLLTLTVWQMMPGPLAPETPVIVRSADTGYPGGRVMVYSTPEQDLTVVWVFGAE